MKHIFLLNPKAGKHGFTTRLRKELSEIAGLDYYVFNTRREGDETELVKIIQNFFDGDKLRFYCCGGSGTMRNMLNGFANPEDVEVAFYPAGMTNDFIKTFGSDSALFADIRNLIEGKKIRVDYIKSNCGIMLNTFSLGMDTITVRTMAEDYRFLAMFNDNLPYNMGVIRAFLSTRQQKYIIEADGVNYSGAVSELFFGNGNVLGGNLYFFENADTADGLAQLRILEPRPSITCFPIMTALINKNYNYLDKHSIISKSSYLKIRRADGGEILANQDGELITGINEWTVEIVHKGLNLIVPKGVGLRDAEKEE